jgi:hypothetical protein
MPFEPMGWHMILSVGIDGKSRFDLPVGKTIDRPPMNADSRG